MSISEEFGPEVLYVPQRAQLKANQILELYDNHMKTGLGFYAYLPYPKNSDDGPSDESILNGIVLDRVQAGLGIRKHPEKENMVITSHEVELFVHVETDENVPEINMPTVVHYSTQPLNWLSN